MYCRGPTRGDSNRQQSVAGFYNTRSCKYFRGPIGRGKRSYGKVNLRVDTSQYLDPMKELVPDLNKLALNKFINDLKDLATSQKGCLLWYTLEYFEKCDLFAPYVQVLLWKCFNNEFIMEVTTRNFLLLCNIETHGERIKAQLFRHLKLVHREIMSFGEMSESSEQLLHTSYDHGLVQADDRLFFDVFGYYKFVNMLFFRCGKHIDSNTQHMNLGYQALCSMQNLLDEGSLDALKLLINIVQFNFNSLSSLFETHFEKEIKKIIHDVMLLIDDYENSQEEDKFYWIAAILDVICNGPVLSKPVYDGYKDILGYEWVKNVEHPPIQVFDMIHEYVFADKLDCFHAHEGDVIRIEDLS